MQNFGPSYDFTTNESSVLIHQSPAEIQINQNVYTGNGEVRLELIPRANIYCFGYFQGVSAKDAMTSSIGQAEISSFSINSRKIEGFRLSSGGDIQSQELNLKWCPKSEPINGVGDDSNQMRTLVFHLFNFRNLIGTRRSTEQQGSMLHAIQHLDLISDQWHIELKSLISTREKMKKIKEDGGYHLTHIVGIENVEGKLFSGREAQEIISAVRFFLSFANGEWCEPICAVGFDASGNRVWEFWSSPREHSQAALSWFDSHNGSQLATLFPLFMKKWHDPDWCQALREIIYWYLNGNSSSRGIDAGIILIQAAIERLSFEYAVKDKRLLIMNGFKDLRASDKFRLLFSSLGIPIEIPKETPEIMKLANKFNWLDAPHALTEIRNSLVHPEHKKRGQLESVYYEAWNLSVWYLEMGLLAICGYSGNYGNRLKQRWLGQVEDVPWVK